MIAAAIASPTPVLPLVPSTIVPPGRSRPSRARNSARPADTEASVFACPTLLADIPAGPHGAALRVTVVNGNLCFVRQPLMVGHSRSLSLTGSEAVVNTLIGGGMRAALNAGLYPDGPGTHQLFLNARTDPDNPWRAPQPGCVIVVGMGSEGKLTEQELVRTVRQGTMAWAQRMAEAGGAPAVRRRPWCRPAVHR